MSAITSLVELSLKCTEAIGRGECPALLSIERAERNRRRVRKRTFFKAITGMHKYRGKHQLRWMTITVHPDHEKDFQQHWRKLIMRLRRRDLIKEYLRCPEKSKKGVRHEHILFLGSYIAQAYLSHLWKAVSGSYIVWINKVVPQTASYLAKYSSKCPEWRVSNSRSWCCRRLCSEWADFKGVSRELHIEFGLMLSLWGQAIRQRVCALSEYIWDYFDNAGYIHKLALERRRSAREAN